MNPYTESIRRFRKVPGNVFINWEKLYHFARDLAQKDLNLPDWTAPVFPEVCDDDFIRFIVVVNSINYCFTDPKTETKYDAKYQGKVWEGAFAMIACVKRALDEGIPMTDPFFLRNISYDHARHIFRCHSTEIPMFQTRVMQLRRLAIDLGEAGMTDFADIFKRADFYVWREDGDSILGILENFNSYQDFRTCKGHTLKFQKRAQLLPMMYYGRAASSQGKLVQIHDPEHIGPISDYQVPRALREIGILEYCLTLAYRIDVLKAPFFENSTSEVDIRVNTVLAMAGLLERINARRSDDRQITMAELDYMIWQAGRKVKTPHHYIYTTAY